MASIRRFALFGAVGALAALGAGCSGDTTTVDTTTQTSIVVRSDTLVAGRGCGAQPGQVFTYVAVVSARLDSGRSGFIGSAAYPCYADATFANLVGTDFQVDIYAFDKPARDAVDAAAAADPKRQTPDFAQLSVSGNYDKLSTSATYRTTCTATQQASVTVLAICPDPLR